MVTFETVINLKTIDNRNVVFKCQEMKTKVLVFANAFSIT